MPNIVPIAAAGVIAYLLYDKYIVKQQSADVNRVLIGSAANPSDKSLPRGIRNNNPGNLKWSSAQVWQGQMGRDSGGFLQFDTAANGLRAAARVIKTYIGTHKLDTIAKIGPRWSPDVNGLTGIYAANVSKFSGIPVSQVLTVNMLPAVLAGIVGAENGGQYVTYYPLSNYTAAVNAA